jgi:hypothetical protein
MAAAVAVVAVAVVAAVAVVVAFQQPVAGPGLVAADGCNPK